MSDRVIDAHLHLDSRDGRTAAQATAELDRQMRAATVEQAVVLHLLIQPWPAEEVAEALTAYPGQVGFLNVDPFAAGAERTLRDGKERLGFRGLKLHPRLQRFDIAAPEVKRLVQAAGEMNLPVLMDAFPDGDWLMMGFDPLAFARLAKECPQTRIVLGHFGGHRCIDFMMLAKRIPNLWFDLSFSLLYYRGSSVPADLLYCCHSMRFSRVLFGTDYPDRPLDVSVRDSLALLDEHGVTGAERERLLWGNAKELLA